MKPLTDARFPLVAAGGGHYESWFVKGNHPTEPRAFWLRHTIHQRPGEPQTAALWLTLFDGDTVRAGKQTFPGARVPATPGGHVDVGGATLHPGRAQGALASPTLGAAWDLTFTGAGPEQRHLPYDWMYDAKVPRTKSGTPYPGVTFGGTVGPFDVTGWSGLVSHNWGSEHAHRWIWHHAALPGRGWIELVFGRLKLGPLTTPWLANGALELDGTRHVLGGLPRTRATKVEEHPTSLRYVVTGADGLRVEGDLRAPRERFVAWRYADPAGPEHHALHTSLADLALDVRGGGARGGAGAGAQATSLHVVHAVSYELGMSADERHGLPVQPYDDGRL